VENDIRDQLAAEFERYAFELIVDVQALRPLRHLSKARPGQTDIVLAGEHVLSGGEICHGNGG
jgi:hypothetical protein